MDKDTEGASGLPEGRAGTGHSSEPRRPRIEVLRPGPAAAPAVAAAEQPTRAPDVVDPAASAQRGSRAYPAGMAPGTAAGRAPPAVAVAERRGGLSGSRFMLLSLLGLLVIAGALLYTYFGQDSGNDAAAEEAVRSENAEFVEEPLIDGEAPPAQAAMPPPATQPEPQPEAQPGPMSEAGEEAVAVEPAPARPVPARPAPAARTADVAAAARPPRPEPEPAAAPRPSGGEASAVNTARAFYSALSNGDGASASRLVVPGKRQSGPLSAGALSRYYSSFRRPLQVRRFTAVNENTVRVAYDYVLADGRLCRGEAVVDVVASGDSRLVRSIRTRGPC